MQRFKKIIIISIVIALCLALSACGKKSRKEIDIYEPIEVGNEYRDFTGELVSGGDFKLSDYEGKVILLNFWATWCGPCVGEMPAFPRLIEKYGNELVLAAVNCGEDADTVSEFLNNNGYTFNVLLDTEYDISNLYPTDGIPYTLIIDREGKISKIHLGASDADSMFEAYCEDIDAVL